MLVPRSVWLAGLLAVGTYAQSTSSTSSSASSDTSSRSSSRGSSSSGSTSSGSASIVTLSATSVTPTGSYASLDGQSTAMDLYGTSTSSSSGSRSRSASGTGSATSISTTASPGSTSTITRLVGGAGIVTVSIINGTVTMSSPHNSTASAGTGSGTATSSSAQATNTQPCNNYPEFCDRKYSNITEVCAHNSAFNIKGNAASNQELSITQQLDDGIRMIQGETHLVNNTIYNCHTSCDLLNAGTYLSELKTVAAWVESHPYDVVTLLIVNSDYVDVGNYTAPLQESGLGPYLYEPPYIPMKKDQWPTLAEMILTQKRVVVFMDYMADQSTVPYILDEFTQMWETPFSPVDRNFPCTTQRPPNLNQTVAKDDFLYLANHNLNTNVAIFGTSILIPNAAELNITNADGYQLGMLGATAGNCTADWDRPPNFLLVDYYNIGNGSVFEVAAKYNNVTYNRKCCGIETSAASVLRSSAAALVVAIVTVLVLTI